MIEAFVIDHHPLNHKTVGRVIIFTCTLRGHVGVYCAMLKVLYVKDAWREVSLHRRETLGDIVYL